MNFVSPEAGCVTLVPGLTPYYVDTFYKTVKDKITPLILFSKN